MLKLPTNAEFKRALDQYGEDRPQPVAACIDGSRPLSETLQALTDAIHRGADAVTVIKSAMVFGLNIGIRIGENRRS